MSLILVPMHWSGLLDTPSKLLRSQKPDFTWRSLRGHDVPDVPGFSTPLFFSHFLSLSKLPLMCQCLKSYSLHPHHPYLSLSSSSPVLCCQQLLFPLHVGVPRLLRRPGSALRVWHHFLCGGLPVLPGLRNERGSLCAVPPVWLHLPQPILPSKWHYGMVLFTAIMALLGTNTQTQKKKMFALTLLQPFCLLLLQSFLVISW